MSAHSCSARAVCIRNVGAGASGTRGRLQCVRQPTFTPKSALTAPCVSATLAPPSVEAPSPSAAESAQPYARAPSSASCGGSGRAGSASTGSGGPLIGTSMQAPGATSESVGAPARRKRERPARRSSQLNISHPSSRDSDGVNSDRATRGPSHKVATTIMTRPFPSRKPQGSTRSPIRLRRDAGSSRMEKHFEPNHFPADARRSHVRGFIRARPRPRPPPAGEMQHLPPRLGCLSPRPSRLSRHGPQAAPPSIGPPARRQCGGPSPARYRRRPPSNVPSLPPPKAAKASGRGRKSRPLRPAVAGLGSARPRRPGAPHRRRSRPADRHLGLRMRVLVGPAAQPVPSPPRR